MEANTSKDSKQVTKEKANERVGTLVGFIDDCEFSSISEARVLTLLVCLYQWHHLREDARKSFALFLGCSEKHITHCLSGGAHLGDEAWEILVSRCGEEADLIRDRWLDEVRRRHNSEEKLS